MTSQPPMRVAAREASENYSLKGLPAANWASFKEKRAKR